MRHIFIEQAFAQWSESVKPEVIAQYGADDVPALSESWNDYTDSLCKDGALNDLQYHYCPAWDDSMPDGSDEPGWILGEMGVAMSFRKVAERPDGFAQGSTHYRTLIKRGAKEMTIFYSMGPAHTTGPDEVGVMHSVLLDTDSIESSLSFEDWANDLGYDTDSRSAERTYKACQEQALQLGILFTKSELNDLREIFENV